MKCPIDATELVMAERQGIEIDYCPRCRGVWLDRGELDKIIERASAQEASLAANLPDRQSPPDTARRSPRPDRDTDRPYGRDYRYRKRKSILSEIFDFD